MITKTRRSELTLPSRAGYCAPRFDRRVFGIENFGLKAGVLNQKFSIKSTVETNILQEIGLSKGESSVYLALIRLGPTKTGALASKAEISTSKVYKILDKLEKKGLAGHITKGKMMFYSAMEPGRILEYIEEKEKKLAEEKEQVKSLIPLLKVEKSLAGEQDDAIVYRGYKAMFNFYRSILDELKAGGEYYVMSAGYGDNARGVKEFFQNYHTQRTKKKIKVKMLANYETKDTLVPATMVCSEVRFLPKMMASKMMVVFYKKKTFMFLLIKEPIGFLIKSKEVADCFHDYFNALWAIAAKSR